MLNFQNVQYTGQIGFRVSHDISMMLSGLVICIVFDHVGFKFLNGRCMLEWFPTPIWHWVKMMLCQIFFAHLPLENVT